MKQRVAIQHDPHMTFPEHKIPAGKGLTFWQEVAQGCFLHVGVTRAGKARRMKRILDKARAIKPEARPAAPQIGRLQKPFRHGHEVIFPVGHPAQMLAHHVAAPGKTAEPAVRPGNHHRAVEGSPACHR